MSGESPLPEVTPAGDSSEQAPERRRRNVGKLERAYVRRRLIVALAREEQTQRELAALYDCAPSAIAQFKERNMSAILEARENLGNEFTGLWIAQKLDRLAELEALFENDVSARDRETKAMLLRHAAEELGQIPNKSTLDITAEVKIRIEGGDEV